MCHPDYRILQSSAVGMTDPELCWAVVEPVWPGEDVTDELEYIGQVTPGQRAVYVTMLYAREVDNGGVKQFLSNSSSLYYEAVLEGLAQIGSVELHQGLSQILQFLPGGKPSLDWFDRKQEVASLSEQQRLAIRKHEDLVFGQEGFEMSLLPCWTLYIQKHPEDFFPLAHIDV